MSVLPRGTVTLLFSDIEGSTQLARRLGDRYAEALGAQRRLMRDAFAASGGSEVDTQGDSFFVAFASAREAVAAAAEAQRGLAAHAWPDGTALAVRVGIHTGEPKLTDDGYVGVDLTHGARICAAAHGGQVLLSKQTRDLLEKGAETIDLGEHVLKDLDGPERLFQLVAPGLRVEFPAPRAHRLGNVPMPRTPLFGRQRELGDLLEALGNETALLTLTGPGGCGKTRLAVEAARLASTCFGGGAFFVSFAPIDDPALVPGLIAAGLGVREQPTEPIVDALLRELQDKETLLVLDNFERVLGAAPLVAELLDAASGLKVIVTSRERLRLTAEHEYPVPTLEDDDAADLFISRAGAARPGLELEPRRGDVVAICRRLDGLPLAIELAAARVRALPLPTIIDRLEGRLRFLSGGARDLPERQRTLAATIAWSYDLLDAVHAAALARLSVFAGGWTIDAAEAVCDDLDDALPVLESLLDKSLVVARTGDDGGARFTMLDTIRDYAFERLSETGAEENIRRLHAEHVLRLAEAAERELQGSEQATWLRRLADERANIQVALTWASAADERAILLRIAGALWRFWFVRGDLREGRRWLADALADDAANATPARARALFGASTLAVADGDLTAARALATDRLDVCRTLGDDADIASALGALANIAAGSGERAEAATLYQEAAEHAREAQAEAALASIVNNLGYLALLEGDSAAAVGRCGEAATLFRRLGFTAEAAGAALNQGVGLLQEGRSEEARACLADSLNTYAALEHTDGVSYCLDAFAAAAAEEGDVSRAAVLLAAADASRRVTGATAPPLEQALHERTRATVEAVLATADLAAASAEGDGMERHEALSLALQTKQDS